MPDPTPLPGRTRREEMMTVSPVELVVAWALTGVVAATLTGCAIRHGEQPTSPWYTRAQGLTTTLLLPWNPQGGR